MHKKTGPPRIETIEKTRLIGIRRQMSFSQNATAELWRAFMPRKHEVPNLAGSELYSVEIYPNTDVFMAFDPQLTFTKWAALAVNEVNEIPDGMQMLEIPAGLYAVFTYTGKSGEAAPVYQYILGTWIPNSEYQLDDRPHFAIMGDRYKGEHPESQEELWFPIKKVE